MVAVIYMDVSVNTNEKYGLNIGTYVIRDVPESHALAFLNQDENETPSIIEWIIWQESKVCFLCGNHRYCISKRDLL